jgi:hypothetical protein
MFVKKFILILFICACIQNLRASDVYNATTIPDALKERADAVIRLHQATFNIQAMDAATYREKNIITVLNKAGQSYATIYLDYDKQRKVKELSGNVYDAHGKLIKKLKSKDFEDYSAFSGSLYQDNRIKYFEHISSSYPYTIEYEYEIAYEGLLHYPGWLPQPAHSVSVEQSDFTVSLPTALDFRFKALNIKDEGKYSITNDRKEYYWEVSDVRTIKEEPFSPPFSELAPEIWKVGKVLPFGSTHLMLAGINYQLQQYRKSILW